MYFNSNFESQYDYTIKIQDKIIVKIRIIKVINDRSNKSILSPLSSRVTCCFSIEMSSWMWCVVKSALKTIIILNEGVFHTF